jgi:hypothetical protein
MKDTKDRIQIAHLCGSATDGYCVADRNSPTFMSKAGVLRWASRNGFTHFDIGVGKTRIPQQYRDVRDA